MTQHNANQLVADVMHRAPICIDRDTSVEEVRARMEEAHVRHILVTDAGLLVGIISDRDIQKWHAPQVLGLEAARFQAKADQLHAYAVMSRRPLAVMSALPLAEAMRLMDAHHLHALPVVDDRGAPIGILTLRDVARRAVVEYPWDAENESPAAPNAS